MNSASIFKGLCPSRLIHVVGNEVSPAQACLGDVDEFVPETERSEQLLKLLMEERVGHVGVARSF